MIINFIIKPIERGGGEKWDPTEIRQCFTK